MHSKPWIDLFLQIETHNGTEYLNMGLVQRVVVIPETTQIEIEVRFGKAETLVLTGESAQAVLRYLQQEQIQRVQRLRQQMRQQKEPLSLAQAEPPEQASLTQPQPQPQPQKRTTTKTLQLATFQTASTTPSIDVEASLQNMALRVQPTTPVSLPVSLEINRDAWLPQTPAAPAATATPPPQPPTP